MKRPKIRITILREDTRYSKFKASFHSRYYSRYIFFYFCFANCSFNDSRSKKSGTCLPGKNYPGKWIL